MLRELTAFVAFLRVAVTGLDGGALAVAVDAVTGAPALLDAPATSHRTMGPVGPGGPAILCDCTEEMISQKGNQDNEMKVPKQIQKESHLVHSEGSTLHLARWRWHTASEGRRFCDTR